MMKKILIIVACLAGSVSMVFGASGIAASFIYVNDGTTAAWYDCQKTSALDDFDGHNFGAFTAGDTLRIEGTEVDTYKNGTDDITNAKLWYRIYSAGSPAFTEHSVGWTSNQPFNDAAGDGYSTAGDQKWADFSGDGGNINVLSGLSTGTYTLEVYQTAHFTYDGGSGDHYANNSGNNYKATFSFTGSSSSVPEAGTMISVLLGACVIRIMRRRRLQA